MQLRLGPPSFQILSTEIERLLPSHHWLLQGDKFAQVQLTWDQDTRLNNSLDNLDDLLILGFNGSQCEIIPASITTNLAKPRQARKITLE